jgi:hypothetical protein
MYYDTIVCKNLSNSEIDVLKHELSIHGNRWTQHLTDLNFTALKDGKTIHINWYDDSGLRNVHTAWDKFPKTYDIIRTFTKEKLGRVYWHRLLPGDTILPHSDASVAFVKSGLLKRRYQLYLDIDPNTEIFFDNRYIDVSKINFSIIDFPLKTLHFYKNKSNSTLYILVFDIFAEGDGIEPGFIL